jgi:hypothetical protein
LFAAQQLDLGGKLVQRLRRGVRVSFLMPYGSEENGPIAWNGALALYIPLASFFTWMVIVTAYGFRNLNRVDQHQLG